MIKEAILVCCCLLYFIISNTYAANLPGDFVYLKNIDPSILQDIRYAGWHNFIGHPITGYQAEECILTQPTALALAKIQQQLQRLALSLQVFDCYRPQQAVDEFISWSKQPAQQQMQAEFYPRVNKADFFKLGYVAKRSAHSRGSTVDLTIVPISVRQRSAYTIKQQKLVACFAPFLTRFQDGGIDMATGFDCMDHLSHNDNTTISSAAQNNRKLLKALMEKYGFTPYQPEWWHFTLSNEPHPTTYFNFAIVASSN